MKGERGRGAVGLPPCAAAPCLSPSALLPSGGCAKEKQESGQPILTALILQGIPPHSRYLCDAYAVLLNHALLQVVDAALLQQVLDLTQIGTLRRQACRQRQTSLLMKTSKSP
jgi:hypothetical protein